MDRVLILTVPTKASLNAAKAASGFSISTQKVDLSVDPSQENGMLDNFHKIFQPAAKKHPGYIEKMLKLRSAVQGGAPEGVNYRFAHNLRKRRAPSKVGGK
jgi:hypothetical protein